MQSPMASVTSRDAVIRFWVQFGTVQLIVEGLP